jgi:hypothetical protein
MNPLEYDNYFKINFIVFILDIFLNFNTGILKKGNLIKSRYRIASTYLKKNLILDSFSIIPLFLNYFDFM